jgi:hypothetical protein
VVHHIRARGLLIFHSASCANRASMTANGGPMLIG